MLKRADKILILLISLLSVVAIAYELCFMDSDAKKLEISVSGQKKEYILSVDQEISIRGANGSLLVQINQGRARVIEAECPDKTCEYTGWITKAPQRIVCVPNQVVVSISTEQPDVDVIVQ